MKLKPSSAIQCLLLILILHATTTNLFSQGISVSFTTSQYFGGYNVSCRYSHDGYIKITNITGGTPPYTYVWNTGQTTDSIGGKYAGIYTLFVTDSTNTTTAAYARLFAPNALTVTLSNTLHNGVDISVYGGNNGNLNSTVNGGNGSYYWNWSNGSSTQNIDNLTAGTYSVTVTDDNGCSTTSYKTLTQPNPLHVDTLSGPLHHGYGVSCNGGNNGAVNLAVSGGVPPYNYNWSGGSFTEDPDNFAAGTYNVHITDDNGAELDTFIVLTQPSPISYDVYTTAVSCHYCTDGIVRAEVSGGVSPYAFQWFNSDDSLISTNDTTGGLASGDYTFVFTDANGCTSAGGPLTIEAPAYVALGGVGVEPHNALCHGGSSGYISFSNGGGTPPYHYQWSSGGTTQNASNLVAGTYTVLVIDSRNDSLQSDVITVGQPTNPISISLDAATYCYDTIICYNVSTRGGSNGNIYPTVNGGTPSYYYSWSNGSTSLNLLNVTAGTYSLTVTDDNGCTMSNSVSLTQPAPFVVSATQELQGSHHLTCADGNDGILVVKWKGGIPEYDFDFHDYSYESELAVLDEFQQNDTVYLRATGFHAGNFHLTVKDAYNVVILDSTFVFTAPDTIKPNYHKSVYPNTYNVGCYNCSNGKITATPTGGTPPYSIEWLDSEGAPLATGDSLPHLHAGDYYYVLTDANGCNAESEMITLTRPDYEEPFHVTVTPHTYIGGYHVSCNGATDGKIRAVVTGGTSPYTFSWSSGATTRNASGLALGTYSVTVTDSGGVHVTVSEVVELVNQPDLMSAWVSHQRWPYDLLVQGGSDGALLIFPYGGQPPYQYSWSTGATTINISGLSAGSYTAVSTDKNGCTVIYPDSITQPPPPAALSLVSITLENHNGYNIACGAYGGNVNVTLSGGVPPYNAEIIGVLRNSINPYGEGSWNDTSFALVNVWGDDSIRVTITDYYNARIDTTIFLSQPPPLNISVTKNNTSSFSKNDGRIDANVFGGLGIVHYTWTSYLNDSNITNNAHPNYIDSLAPGLYHVNISDSNGCGGNFERWIMQGGGAWGINGNDNITDASQYLGTTDYNDLVLKTNGQERMRISGDGNMTISDGYVPKMSIRENGAIEFHRLRPESGFAIALIDSNGNFGSVGQNTPNGYVQGPKTISVGMFPANNPKPSPGTGNTVWPFRQSQFNDSNMFTKWNKLGLGTDNPQERLEVAGKGRFTDEDSASKYVDVGFSSQDSAGIINSSGDLVLASNGVEGLRAKPSGEVIAKKMVFDTIRVKRILPVLGDSVVHIGDSSLVFLSYNNNSIPNTNICDRIYSSSQKSGLGLGALNALASARKSMAIGYDIETKGNNSIALGNYIQSTNTSFNSVTIGGGFFNPPASAPTYLVNNTPFSLFVGFNSNIPTFVVGSANGVNTTGNTGIGTMPSSTPNAKLHTQGFTIIDGPEASLMFGNDNADKPYGDFGIEYFDHAPNVGLEGLNFWKPWQARYGDKNFIFYIANNGSVGINIDNNSADLLKLDNPDYKLNVNGGIRGTKVRVELYSTWPDFVFEKDYRLKSLYEVEKFINDNKHLPGLPTAAEVKKDGFDLGETQAKLLEKIEELTLYVIEIKKENDTFKAELEKLKQKK